MDYDSFFGRKTEDVARGLIGRLIIRKTNTGVFAAQIVETGAYVGIGDADPNGPRKGMFYDAGKIFLMDFRGHKLFNLASGNSGPACVELRALTGERKIEGSGAITNYLKITPDLDGKLLGDISGVWISDDAYNGGKIVCSSGAADNCKGIYSLT